MIQREPMKALTVWQPWASLIFLDKNIENRTWRPPQWLIGKRIAIHAGKTMEAAFAATRMPDGFVFPRGAILGIVRVTGCVTESTDEYFVGPYGWTLDEKIALPKPIPCRGAQGLWDVPEEIARKLEERGVA